MEKVVITPEEMAVIQEYLDGKIGLFSATQHQMTVMSKVIDDAHALLDKLNAYDELAETPKMDMVRWYLSKAETQE